MKLEIQIEVHQFPEDGDESQRDEFNKQNHMAWIEGNEYKGILVTGASIGECLKELGISLIVMDKYLASKITRL